MPRAIVDAPQPARAMTNETHFQEPHHARHRAVLIARVALCCSRACAARTAQPRSAELAAAAGEVHPAARPRLRRRHRRAADRRKARRQMGPAGRGREPARRRRLRRHHRFHQRPRRSCPAVRAGVVVHRASRILHEKLPYDPRDLAPVARVSATLVTIAVPPSLDVKIARRSRRDGARATRQAQLGDHHRRHRSGARRLPQERRASTWRKSPIAIRCRR